MAEEAAASADLFGENTVSIFSLLSTSGLLITSYIIALFIGRNSSTKDRWIIVWLLFDVLVNFVLEGPYVYLTLKGSFETSDCFLSKLWQEYGKADKRVLHFDANILTVELVTVVFGGLTALLLIHAIVSHKYYRHFLQITLCISGLYGGVMYFVPELLIGSPNLDTSNPLYLWVYIVYFNGLWVLMSFLLLCDSWCALAKLHDHGPTTHHYQTTTHKKKK